MKKKLLLSGIALSLGFSSLVFAEGPNPLKACEADQKKFCADVKPGEGRIMQCMTANQSKLSSECASLIQKKQEEEAKWKARKQQEAAGGK